MAIPKTPKPKKAKSAKKEAEDLVPCVTCNRRLKPQAMQFHMPTFLDGEEWACSVPCYHTWNTDRMAKDGVKVPPQARRWIENGELG